MLSINELVNKVMTCDEEERALYPYKVMLDSLEEVDIDDLVLEYGDLFLANSYKALIECGLFESEEEIKKVSEELLNTQAEKDGKKLSLVTKYNLDEEGVIWAIDVEIAKNYQVQLKLERMIEDGTLEI